MVPQGSRLRLSWRTSVKVPEGGWAAGPRAEKSLSSGLWGC